MSSLFFNLSFITEHYYVTGKEGHTDWTLVSCRLTFPHISADDSTVNLTRAQSFHFVIKHFKEIEDVLQS